MKKRTIFSTLLTLFATATLWATPFVTTTVTEGSFAEDTQWYTLRLGTSGAVLADNEGAEYITVGRASTQYEAKDLWCFTGNETDGYTIYNRQAGPNMVLASSTSMDANGANTYPILYDKSSLPAGHVTSWDFITSTSIANVEGYYMQLHGTGNTLTFNKDIPLSITTPEGTQPIRLYDLQGNPTEGTTTGIYVTSEGQKVWIKR